VCVCDKISNIIILSNKSKTHMKYE